MRLTRRIILLVSLLLLSTFMFAYATEVDEVLVVNNEVKDEVIDTKWVYDTTNSISQKTINYIDGLNETILKDYQYAVFVVENIDKSMDAYKKDLFNELGVGNKELNSGILFVLATEDREYGLEIGDGIQGKLRQTLERDFIQDSAINELRAGDWDMAVVNISSALAKKIEEFNKITTAIPENSNNLIVEDANITDKSNSSIVLLLPILIVFIVALLLLCSEDNMLERIRFFRSKDFNDFININNLNKKEVKKQFKNEYTFTLNENGLYAKSMEIMQTKLKDRYNLDIMLKDVKRLSAIETYSEIKNKSLTYEVEKVYEAYKEEERKCEAEIKALEELKIKNIEWIDKFIEENDGYNLIVMDELKVSLDNNANLQNNYIEMSDWIKLNYKVQELKTQFKIMFPDKSQSEINKIMNDLKGRSEYERFVSGKDAVFQPNSSEKQYKHYNNHDNKNNSFLNSPLFWIWLYGNNHIKEQTQIEEDRLAKEASRRAKQRRDEERRDEERRNSSFNSFGSGFGGGSSSGGGFSGKF